MVPETRNSATAERPTWDRCVRLLLAATVCTLPLVAQESGEPATEGTSEEATDANTDLLSHIDEALDREIRALSDLARGRADGPIEHAEDLNRTLPEGAGQLGYNAVTSNANPLVSDDCHRDAMRDAILSLAEHEHLSPREAVDMGRGHLAEREAHIEEGEVTYADYIEHIAACKAFCGPLVKELIGCHVTAVKNLERDIVFFPLDSFEVAGAESARAIQHVADSLDVDGARRVLLVGRASRIGQLGYNRRLSGQRANAVRDRLATMGVDADRVRTLVFGYEPPQIDGEIAGAYGYGDLFARIGVDRMNQSVLMVVY